jgi:NTP pyrophosphatase (non-canonical NTP hydrolase)
MSDFLSDWEAKVKQWGSDRNIILGSTPRKQYFKLQEEVHEMFEGIVAGESFGKDAGKDDVKDAIGDQIVVLTMIAAMYNLELKECMEKAWGDIEHRTGRIIDGVFVKDAS